MGLNKKHLNAAELQEFLDEKKILPADPMTPYIVKAELDVDGDGRMKYNILMTERYTFLALNLVFFGPNLWPKLFLFWPKSLTFLAQIIVFLAQIKTFLAQITTFLVHF